MNKAPYALSLEFCGSKSQMMINVKKEELVLVTGGTGFVGIHCILQLLQAGYAVRTTIRSLTRKQEVLDMLRNGNVDPADKVHFIEADLTKDDNWTEAVKDCDYVLHVASPISFDIPEKETEIIKPAVEGTLRVLKAAKNAGVKRVVLTSSFAAVGYSHQEPGKLITETSWTDPNDKNLSAYLRSKTLAEKAAWDFIAGQANANAGINAANANTDTTMELSVINPVGIFGPLLGADLSTGHEILKRLLDGSMKATPKIPFGIVDVRDVADLHLRAMVNPKANGQRFLALAGEIMWLPGIALLLKNKMGDKGQKITTKTLPDWLVRAAALFNPMAKKIVPQLGRIKNASNEKARLLLGWSPRTNEEAILSAAESLFRFGVVETAS